MKDLNQLELALAAPFTSDIKVLQDILNNSVLSRGKRVRPMMLILISRILGYEGEMLWELAASVEHIHAASLLHDDVIDNASHRRGNLSVNQTHGNSYAVLAGDYLYTRSFISVLALKDKRIANESINVLTRTVAQMSEAEILQLSVLAAKNINEQDYYKIVYGKTVALFLASCVCAGILCNASGNIKNALYDYGLNIGFGFQLMDDILDYFGDELQMGKKTGGDLHEQKITLPVIKLMQHLGEDKVKNMFFSQKNDDEKLEEFNCFFEKFNIKNESIETANQYISKAEAALELLPDNNFRSALIKLTSNLRYRNS